MTPRQEAKLTLRKYFFWQWILATMLGYGVGFSLSGPFFNRENLIVTFSISGLVIGLAIGFAQWLVLRPFLPGWILVYIYYPCLITVLGSALNNLLPFFIPLLLPIVSTIAQWRLLREAIRPCWTWILWNLHIYLLTFGSWVVIYRGLLTFYLDPSIVILTSGLAAGSINGILSGLVLIRLVKKAQPISQEAQHKINQGTRDHPPEQKLWIRNILSWSIIPLTVGWFFFIPEPTLSSSSFLILFLSLYGYLFVSVLIHELGHLSFALLNRFKFKFLAVDRWVLSYREQRLRIQRFHRLAAGGLTATIPTNLDPNRLKQHLIWMILGGPLASFLLFLSGTIFLLFPETLSKNSVIWSLTFLSIYNFYMTILNLLPIKFGYFPTDGRLIWNLVQNNPEGKQFIALYRYLGSLAQGIRPRDLDPEILSDALAVSEPSMHHISGLMMAYQRALDRGEFQTAGQFLDQALELKNYWPEFNRATLFLEGIYFEARIRQHPDIARQWFEQVQEQMLILVESYAFLRAEAALLLAEGQTQEAVTKAEQALQLAAQDLLNRGAAIAEVEWLQAIIQEGIQKQKENQHS
jgi:tetratricopeptide (TPR) repeat protein